MAIKQCEICGCTIINLGNRRYCKQCAKQVRKEWRKTYGRKWRLKNPNYWRKWRKANPGKKAEYDRRYYNPEKRSIRNRQRYAWEKGAEGNYTAEDFKMLCKEFHYRCACCGRKVKLEADHIVPLSKGGSNNIDNIQPLCKSCNSSKKDRTIDYR